MILDEAVLAQQMVEKLGLVEACKKVLRAIEDVEDEGANAFQRDLLKSIYKVHPYVKPFVEDGPISGASFRMVRSLLKLSTNDVRLSTGLRTTMMWYLESETDTFISILDYYKLKGFYLVELNKIRK